jgi:hypothetical protein
MRFVLIVIFSSWIQFGFGQVEQPQQFWTNFSMINPAFLGAERSRFVDLTYSYSIKERGVGHSYFLNSDFGSNFGSIGINYQATNYSIGTDGLLQLNLAKHILRDCRPGMTKHLNLGASVGLIHTIDTATSTTRFQPDINFGFALTKVDKLIGISLKHLLNNDLEFSDQLKPSIDVTFKYGRKFIRNSQIYTLGNISLNHSNVSWHLGFQLSKRYRYKLILSYSSKHDISLHFERMIPRKNQYVRRFRFGMSAGYRLWNEGLSFWSSEVHVGVPLW